MGNLKVKGKRKKEQRAPKSGGSRQKGHVGAPEETGDVAGRLAAAGSGRR